MKTIVGPIILYLTTFLICVGLVAVPSCGSTDCKDPKYASTVGCNVLNAIVDCTGVTSLPTLVAEVTPQVDKLVSTARMTDGSINWPAIQMDLEGVVLKYGACVIAQIFNDYINPPASPKPVPVPPVGPGSGGQVAPEMQARIVVRPPADSAKAEFALLRARLFPGKQMRLIGGGAL